MAGNACGLLQKGCDLAVPARLPLWRIIASILHLICLCLDETVHDCKNLRTDQEPESGREYIMYHGTHKANARAIISSGFQRSSDGLLGPGVYVSRDVNKALCYPRNVNDDDRVVFKLRVRVGKVKKIDCNNHPLQKRWHQSGYDTAWVPPQSSITTIITGREEDCVWDPKRISVVGVSYCNDVHTMDLLKDLIKATRSESRRGKPMMLIGTVIDAPDFLTSFSILSFILNATPFYLRDCFYALYVHFCILDLFFQRICSLGGVGLQVLVLNILSIYCLIWVVLSNMYFLMFCGLVVFVTFRVR
ncbi:uncharacterized protein [Ambystoma mexicanum]|uniref:uncharacterized protein isoform X2 n=1 Tax=Ambystoma mexicanum TaxID=8296 RepID=UPI0037E81EC8